MSASSLVPLLSAALLLGCTHDWDSLEAGGSGGDGAGAMGSTYVCTDADDCDFSCQEANCKITCNEAANCTASCNGGGCEMICAGAADCSFSCTGGGCEFNCNTADDCNTSCTGGMCTNM